MSSTIHLTLKMTSAQVVETSVKVTTKSPSQDYTQPDDHNLRTYDMIPGFKPFTSILLLSSFGGFHIEYVTDVPCIMAVFRHCLDLAGVLHKVPCSRPDSHTPLNANYSLHRSIKTFTTPEYYDTIRAPVTNRSEVFTSNVKPRSESRTDRPSICGVC